MRQRLFEPKYQAGPVIAKRRYRPSYCGAESDPVGQDRGQFLYPGAVLMIEASLFGAVQVDNRDDLAFADPLTGVLIVVVTAGALILGWGVAALVDLCRDLAAGIG